MRRQPKSLEGLAARIGRLEDIEAIKQLKARYAQGCDPTHNVEFLMSLFTEDAVFDVGERYGRYEGKAAIRKFLQGADGIIPWAIHYVISPVIELAEDAGTARGTWHLWELANMMNTNTGEQEAVWIAGAYHDEFVKQDGQWRISKVVLKMEIMSPYAEGWAKKPWRD